MMDGTGYGQHMTTWGWLLMAGWITLTVVGIVALVWWIVRGTRSGGNSQPREELPVDVLKRRYAAGEIDDEEFERRRKGLGA